MRRRSPETPRPIAPRSGASFLSWSRQDGGQSGAEQCQKAYHAALAFAKGSGRTAKQSAELAATVAQRAAVRAELTPQEQVDCVVKAAQVRCSWRA